MESHQRSRKRRSVRGATPLLALLIAVAFGVNCMSTISSLTPKRYAVAEGEPAPETILATRMVAVASRSHA